MEFYKPLFTKLGFVDLEKNTYKDSDGANESLCQAPNAINMDKFGTPAKARIFTETCANEMMEIRCSGKSNLFITVVNETL
ncbi:hypothetical protein WISP_141677 [Willisornis vidua]|uniref:Uncharacterized protein n=1 Tax=Willisornis vidua TaxID=1566151 RepID=A0ABQ9CM16_9PASS|nr:hypothetical protein WISP_141677 [Willisornis vidua]